MTRTAWGHALLTLTDDGTVLDAWFPSPTTTPWLMRPSTIDVPRVPALKLTKPSCMTVVPLARWAPSRTRPASAMRTPDGTT